MLDDAVAAIKKAGYIPGKDVFLAIDVASSRFFKNEYYHLDKKEVNSREMIDIISTWTKQYPLVSVEDGLAEEDWKHWPMLKKQIQGKALVLGDDLLCTNPERIQKAIAADAANALLLKVNQIGSLTEAAHAYQLAKEAGWQITISARSGETEDNWLADLAVGWEGDQIKIGSITQSERLAKYNRLLMIEEETKFPMNQWPEL
jgi:enolase